MTLKQTLKALAAAVLEEADRNPEFALRLEQALGQAASEPSPKKSRARNAALLDPIAVLDGQGEPELRRRLQDLSVDQQLDVVAEFGMDPAKLVMKWKNPDRIIEHIVDSSKRRSVKGDAFRAKPADGAAG